MKNSTIHPSRRDFVKGAAAIGTFTILPSYLMAGKKKRGKKEDSKLPPSKRINLACIGADGRARGDIPALAGAGAEIVALCDLDPKRGVKIKKRFSKAQQFTDFRKMLDKVGKDVDAVSIVVPDHMHFCATILAMSMGKHVYTEKPLTQTYWESELLMRAEKKYGVVTQMGNQGHTSGGSNQFKTWVENGIVKDITRVDAWKTSSLWFMNKRNRIDKWPQGETCPAGLDWDLWCGPRPVKPFTKKCHPFSWRGFYAFGGGMLGDWGAHIIDFPHEYLKLGLPTEIEAIKMVDHNQVIFPLETRLKFHFPERGPGMPACDLFWSDGGDCIPKLDPEKYGKVKPGGAGKICYGKELTFLCGHHSGLSRVIPDKKRIELGEKLKVPNLRLNHYSSFINACKGNGKTWSRFSVSGELTKVLMLGCIAQYLNTNLKFDPKTEKFIGNDQANFLLRGPKPRAGWEQYYNMA